MMTVLAILKELRLAKGRPFSVTEAAWYSRVPGKTAAGRAQKLRRLEARGVVLAAGRSLIHDDRYYEPVDVLRLRLALGAA